MNGNMSREGITADLEAMKRVGIGNVLFLEVDLQIPAGPVRFGTPQWREMFKYAIDEAGRLGLEVRIMNGPGYSLSGGPWINPPQAMQKVVYAETAVEGPRHFKGKLPQPKTLLNYYQDIVVLAFPTPPADADPRKKIRIKQLEGKSALIREYAPPPTKRETLPAEAIVDRGRIVNLWANFDKGGNLIWDVPAGKWTIIRVGHTPTGATNRPAVAEGLGLDADHLDKTSLDIHFKAYLAKRLSEVGSAAGRTLTFAHVDSWESHSQNWTKYMREEFKKRRGYDPQPLIPVMAGHVVDSLDVSERFLWDLRKTIAELNNENAEYLRELSHRHGLKLSIEAYGNGMFDEISYAGRADVPMCEFWTGGDDLVTIKPMTSAAHTYGKQIVGAESFTSDPSCDRWTNHPFSMKSLGDFAFSAGINHFFFHTYTHQPWLDRKPGMTMMMCGVHYERTQTWWELSRPWHEYLARCNYLLRQGLFVADIAYLQAEGAPNTWEFPIYTSNTLYQFDAATPEVVLTRMSVRNGRLVLPDGMNYRLLVLPNYEMMTPRLLHKLKDLVKAGATVIGPRPIQSPSLTDYPNCDQEIKNLADELWGDCDGLKVKEHHYGKGRIIFGKTPETVLAEMGVTPDLQCGAPGTPLPVRYIHRTVDGTEIYFIANTSQQPQDLVCTFRVKGKRPELWHPDTGRTEPAAMAHEAGNGVQIPIYFDPRESLFVVFRPEKENPAERVATLMHDGKTIVPAATPQASITVNKAFFTRETLSSSQSISTDVTAKMQENIAQGKRTFFVGSLAPGEVSGLDFWAKLKSLRVEYMTDGTSHTVSGLEPEIVVLSGAKPRDAALSREENGRMFLEARKPGHYEVKMNSGKIHNVDIPDLPQPIAVPGPWELRFPAGWGAPNQVTLDKLISWTDHPTSGIKYFSGMATYTKNIQVPPAMLSKNRHLYLDLGKVQIIAEVKLNGKNLGILWKPPFRVEITEVVKAGDNALEVSVTNLWVNRLIGDEQLPKDCNQRPDGSLAEWPKWLVEGKASPTGRYTFSSWRLWEKGSPLLESGLIGPVTLQATACVRVR